MNDRPSTAVVAVRPRSGAERIVALDALRGFALLGILLVNVLDFSGIRGLGVEAEGADRIVEGLLRYFAQGKFLSLFAMLFGISFTLQLASLQRQGADLFPTWWRRLGALFLFGVLHTGLDPSEVLAVYALCGAALVLFRVVPWKAVLLLALLLMGLPYLHTAIVTPAYVATTSAAAAPEAPAGAENPAASEEADEPATPEEGVAAAPEYDTTTKPEEDDMHAWDAYLGALAIRVHSSGTFVEVVRYNYRFAVRRWTRSWVSYLWMTVPLPLMMVGLLIGRSGILTRIDQERSRLNKVFWFGLVSGLVAVWLAFVLSGAAGKRGWNPWIAFPAQWLFALSGLIMALAYAAGLLVLLQRSFGVKIQAALAPAGRMALTNYLLQTVICTSLFYAYGLGLYGQVGATQAAVIAVAVFALQVVFSHLWLRAFRFGPVEWLWRMATYWRVLPLRRG